jgi:FtsZ-binding cell division protein ZapB
VESAIPIDDADRQQIDTLCDDLQARAETVRAEQALLDHLVQTTARTRPHRSRQYQVLRDQAQSHFQRLRALIVRYCGW